MAVCAWALPAKEEVTSYDGVKVVRVVTENDLRAANKVVKIIAELGLSKWTSVVEVNKPIDFEVPADKWEDFNQRVSGTSFKIMHEDLGQSIREESAGSERNGESEFSDPGV